MSGLKATNIHSGYGTNEILHGIDLKVAEDEIVGIIGPNGAGKSTTFKTIFGLLDVWEGSLHYDGDDIIHTNIRGRLDHGIVYIPQGKSTFTEMTVLENLQMSAFTRDDNYSDDLQRVYDSFPILEEKKNQKAKNLSGGQQQMLEMGGGLLMEPSLMLLDEPSLGLAPQIASDVFERIKRLNSEEDISFLVIEQNARRAMEVSERTYVIDLGQNEFEGQSEDLLDNNEIQQLYLGGAE